MTEQEYYELAKKRKEENLMDEYWQEIARTGKWISKDGTETYFRDLDLKHMLNIINGLLDFKNENCKLVVKRLIQQLVVRATRKTPKYVFEMLDNLTQECVNKADSEEKKAEFIEWCETVKQFLQ